MIIEILDGLIAKVIADEVRDTMPTATNWLIVKAVSRLPENQRDRFLEEWSSHIDGTRGTIGKMLTSFGFLIAAQKMQSAFQAGYELERTEKLMRWLEEASLSFISEALLADRPELKLIQPASRDRFVSELACEYVREGGLAKVAQAYRALEGTSKHPMGDDSILKLAVREVAGKKRPSEDDLGPWHTKLAQRFRRYMTTKKIRRLQRALEKNDAEFIKLRKTLRT